MTQKRKRSVTFRDVDRVKNMIERCLVLYMDKKQTVETLWTEEKIEPVFTEIVWQRLNQDNPQFFKAYCVGLFLKHQMAAFNELLEMQANSMGTTRKSVCGSCGTAFFHCCRAIYVCCTNCSAIFTVRPQENGTGHASTQCMPSNADPLSSIKHVGCLGNPNIQINGEYLCCFERMGIPATIPAHATSHASTSSAAQYMPFNSNSPTAINYGGSFEIPNIQALTSLAAQHMPNNVDPVSDMKDSEFSGNPDIQGREHRLPLIRLFGLCQVLRNPRLKIRVCSEVCVVSVAP